MKPSKPSSTYRPFKHLKAILDEKAFPLASGLKEKPTAKSQDDTTPSADDEERLFQEEMADVAPIVQDAPPRHTRPVRRPRTREHDDPEAEALASLKGLVGGGEGFVISDTPEYMEGVGYGVNPEIAKRLHRGDFSIQAHLDLHGLGVEEAHEAFEQFLKEALLAGRSSVLVVHGRGLSSRAKPVLKSKVKQWLTTGPWRKWVVAFTSARACDGGTGATCILLRKRPATKRFRKGGGKQ